jgi:lysophospholipase L1-like esterase
MAIASILELGGNDALRGLALQSTQQNLEVMIKAAREAGAQVLLVGMQVPPNYGAAYTEQFAEMFRSIADAQKLPLVPFLLSGIGDGGRRAMVSERPHSPQCPGPATDAGQCLAQAQAIAEISDGRAASVAAASAITAGVAAVRPAGSSRLPRRKNSCR